MDKASKALADAGFEGANLKDQLTSLGSQIRLENLISDTQKTTEDLGKSAQAAEKLAEISLFGKQAVHDYNLELEITKATETLRAAGLNEMADNLANLIRYEDKWNEVRSHNENIANLVADNAWLEKEVYLRQQNLPNLERELEIQKELWALQQEGWSDTELKTVEDLLRKKDLLSKQNELLIQNFERMKQLANDIKDAFANAFTDLIIRGKSVKEVLLDLLQTLAELLFKAGTQQLFNNFGNILGGLLTGSPTSTGTAGAVQIAALGKVFNNGSVTPFASGGIVKSPTLFDVGLMGERGPEAIMPLRRGSDGKLGVASSGNGGNVYNFNAVINVEGGSSGNAAADDQLAKRIGKQLNDNFRQMVISVFDEQARPGGRLYKGIG